MKILALEFSSERRGVAVSSGLTVRGYAEEHEARETRAFALIEAALREAQLGREEIECIAVGTGPGSYAGIRIAIAIAQGWQLGSDVKLVGISSAEAIARGAQQRGIHGIVNIVFDAQRNEAYATRYEVDSTRSVMIDSLALLTADQERERRGRGEIFVRADRGAWPGDAAVVLPDVRIIAELATTRHDYVTGPHLEPVYLRKAEFTKAPPARRPI